MRSVPTRRMPAARRRPRAQTRRPARPRAAVKNSAPADARTHFGLRRSTARRRTPPRGTRRFGRAEDRAGVAGVGDGSRARRANVASREIFDRRPRRCAADRRRTGRGVTVGAPLARARRRRRRVTVGSARRRRARRAVARRRPPRAATPASSASRDEHRPLDHERLLFVTRARDRAARRRSRWIRGWCGPRRCQDACSRSRLTVARARRSPLSRRRRPWRDRRGRRTPRGRSRRGRPAPCGRPRSRRRSGRR